MNKTYQSPALRTTFIVGTHHLLGSSIQVSNETVSNSADIGFVKGDNSSRGGHSVWDDDWSK